MRILTHHPDIEIRESPIEGFGVFATDNILAGTLLEEVPFILFPRYVALSKFIFDTLKANSWIPEKELYMDNLVNNLGFKHPDRYYFKWHPHIKVAGDSMYTVLPLGFGPVYNTSNTNNNADWKMLKDTFTFTAEKHIAKDEEIRTFYGYFLGEDGTIFHCEDVFHFAMDMFDYGGTKEHRIKMLRFGSVETFEAQKNNPSALKINTFISKSIDGIKLTKVTLLQSDGTSIYTFDVPANVSMSMLYTRLSEVKAHICPLVKFEIQYTDKLTSEKVNGEVLWKK
jgi:hypothetical protein